MTLQELANLGQSQGFRIVDNQIVGIYNGYTFRLTMNNKADKDTIIISIALDRNVPGKVRKSIKNSLPKGTNVGILTAGSFVLNVICKTESSSDAFEVTVSALDTITQNLSSAEKPISNPNKCPICKKEDCDSAALSNGNYVKVHRQCVEDQTQKEVDSADQNQLSGSYLTGIIGAIIGAIVGCIPTIITINFMETEWGVLYVLIPLASFFGYKLLKGRRGLTASFIVTIASILAFIIINPTILYVYIAPRGYSFLEAVKLYYFESTLTELLEYTWFGALFLIIGIVSGFKMMGITNDDRIRSAMSNIDSIIPLNGNADSIGNTAGSTKSSSDNIDPWLR